MPAAGPPAFLGDQTRYAILLPMRLHGPSLGAIVVEQDEKDALKFAMNGDIAVSVRKIYQFVLICVTTDSTKFLALCFCDEVLG